MNSITQDMKFRQSLMNYAKKYGVSRASRKYNKSRSYIYFWLKRWDGSVESLAVKSRRPHHHPNEHTKEEIDLIKRYHKRNPTLELPELWHRLRKQGYTRCLESLYRVMKKLGMLPKKPKKATYKPKKRNSFRITLRPRIGSFQVEFQRLHFFLGSKGGGQPLEFFLPFVVPVAFIEDLAAPASVGIAELEAALPEIADTAGGVFSGNGPGRMISLFLPRWE